MVLERELARHCDVTRNPRPRKIRVSHHDVHHGILMVFTVNVATMMRTTRRSWLLLRLIVCTSFFRLYPNFPLAVEASPQIPSFTRNQEEQSQQQRDPPTNHHQEDTSSITSFFWNAASSIRDFFSYHSTQFYKDVNYHSTQFQKDFNYHSTQIQQDSLALTEEIYNTLEMTKDQIQKDLQQVNDAGTRYLRKTQREVKK